MVWSCGSLRAFQSRYPKVLIGLRTRPVGEIAAFIIIAGVEFGVAHNPVPRDGVVRIAHEVFESAEAKLLLRKGPRLSPAANDQSRLMSARIAGLVRFA